MFSFISLVFQNISPYDCGRRSAWSDQKLHQKSANRERKSCPILTKCIELGKTTQKKKAKDTEKGIQNAIETDSIRCVQHSPSVHRYSSQCVAPASAINTLPALPHAVNVLHRGAEKWNEKRIKNKQVREKERTLLKGREREAIQKKCKTLHCIQTVDATLTLSADGRLAFLRGSICDVNFAWRRAFECTARAG